MRRMAVVIGTVAALAACSSSETAQQMQARMDTESAALKTAASAVERTHETAFASGDAGAFANTFTENGRELPPNQPANVGRAAIRDNAAQGMAAYTQKLTVTQQSVVANGPIGIETGTYAYQGTVKKGAPKGMPAKVSDHGNYLVHWHNVNGTWQIADLMYTSSEMTPTVKAMTVAGAAAAKAAAAKAKAAAKPAAAKKPTTRKK